MSPWLAAIPALGTTVFVLLAPGLLLALGLGLRGILAWGAAPVFSMSVLTVGAVGASVAGVRWSPGVAAACTAASLAFALAVGVAMRRRLRPPAEPRHASLGATAGAALGVLASLASAVPGMRRPDNLVDSMDAVFHLNRMRSMLTSGDISSLGGTGFYPSGFHDLAVTAMQLHPVPLITSSNMVVLAFTAVAWPIGCVAMARQVFGSRPAPLIAAGVCSASFLAFPSYLLGWGVVWAQVAGIAVVPGTVALVLAAAGRPETDQRPHRRLAAVAVVLAVPGVFLAHPTGVVTLAGLGASMVVGALLRTAVVRPERRRRALSGLAALAFLTIGAAAALPVASRQIAVLSSFHWMTFETVPQAIRSALTNAPHFQPQLWVLSAVVLLGLGAAVIRLDAVLWAAVGFVVFSALYVLAAAVNSSFTAMYTGFWYNDAVRVAASVPVPAVVLAVAGLEVLNRAAARLLLRAPALGSGRWVPAVLAPSLVGVLFLAGTGLNNQAAKVDLVAHYYSPKERGRQLADAGELRDLAALGRMVPADAGIAGVAANGSALVYALTGRHTLFTTLSPVRGGDTEIIAGGLDHVASRPDVCDALRRQHIRYAITGKAYYWARNGNDDIDRGMVSLAGRPGLERVASRGRFNLYRVTACGES
ncbi:MAG: DUF6541 family protein [Oryzihumus sp.]